jgi:hypothetical protein
MKPGLASRVEGMRRTRCYVAEVTGNSPDELEAAALAEAASYFPGSRLEVSGTYSFRKRHLTIRETVTGEPDPAEGRHALQASINVYELVPDGSQDGPSPAGRDSEHTVVVPAGELEHLRLWLARPNGSSGHMGEDHRVSFDSVEGGAVMVRTRPWTVPSARPRLR